KLFKTFDPLLPATDGQMQNQDFIAFTAANTLVRIATPKSGNPYFEIIQLPSLRRVAFEHPLKGFFTEFDVNKTGELLATSAFNDVLKLWDIKTGTLVKTLGGQLIGFTSVAFSHDGTRLAAGGWDGTITLWELPSGRQVASWKAHPRN